MGMRLLLGIPSKWFCLFQKNWLFYRANFPDTIRSHTESPFPCGWTRRAAMRHVGCPSALQLQLVNTCVQEEKRMMHTSPSVCPLDCADTCSFTVTVEDEHIVKVRGSRRNPLTHLKRTGPKGAGQFARITWEEALDLISTRFACIQQEYGAEAIVPLNYAGPHGFLAGGSMDLRFFHRLGASNLARRPLCGGVKSEAFVSTY